MEKSLCAEDKAKNQYWLPMIFTSSGSTALKSGILSWKSLDGLPEIPVCEQSSSCHPQMQLKALMKRRSHMWTWNRNTGVFSGAKLDLSADRPNFPPTERTYFIMCQMFYVLLWIKCFIFEICKPLHCIFIYILHSISTIFGTGVELCKQTLHKVFIVK